MDTVENEIRRTFRAPVTLHIFGWQKPFELSQIDNDGIVLLLRKRQDTRRAVLGLPGPRRYDWDSMGRHRQKLGA